MTKVEMIGLDWDLNPYLSSESALCEEHMIVTLSMKQRKGKMGGNILEMNKKMPL
jgi:hypothetical protein